MYGGRDQLLRDRDLFFAGRDHFALDDIIFH